MKPRTEISHFIPCDCREGGILINGIAWDYERFSESAWIWLSIVHKGRLNKISFWQHLKYAFGFLFKKDLYFEDMTLNKEQIIKLKDVCQDALNRWPEYEAVESVESLDKFYQELTDEERGKEIRLQEGGK